MHKKNRAFKLTSALLCLLLLVQGVSVFASGAATQAASGVADESREIRILSYNIHGLPLVNSKEKSPFQNTRDIAAALNAEDYNLICVQEDFNFHYNFDKALNGLKYRSRSSGTIPVGDGLNVFSDYKLYNIGRVTWRSASGVFDWGMDELTPKGILYFTIEVEKGVYIDVYDIHADACDDVDSMAARQDNLIQLAELIESRDTGRAIMIMGDFNTFIHKTQTAIRDCLLKPLGLKDAWAEVMNGGNYDTTTNPQTGLDYLWGTWNSVDRVLYRDGKNVAFNAKSFGYRWFGDENGVDYSDHSGAELVMSYTVTGTPETDNSLTIGEEKNIFELMVFQIQAFFKALKVAIYEIPQLPQIIYNAIFAEK